MRTIIAQKWQSLFLIGLCLVSAIASAQQPEWLYRLDLKDNEIAGFGISDSYEDAKAYALKEISETLQVEVNSEYLATELVSSSRAELTSVSSIGAISKAKLFGVKVVRSELAGGLWYVGMVYDDSSLAMKINRIAKVDESESGRQNLVFERAPLIKGLNDELGVMLDYGLIRKNGLWQLDVQDHLFPLLKSQIIQLFHSHKAKKVKLLVGKKQYISGDHFKLNVLLEEPGYVSLVYTESTGKTGVIYANKYAKHAIDFPDKGSELIMSNPESQTITEMYVAFWSKKPLNLDRLNNVSADYLDTGSYGLDILLSMMAGTTYSSEVIKIAN